MEGRVEGKVTYDEHSIFKKVIHHGMTRAAFYRQLYFLLILHNNVHIKREILFNKNVSRDIFLS